MDDNTGAKLSEPTYKVNIEVEGVKTQAFCWTVITLVRIELLPMIE